MAPGAQMGRSVGQGQLGWRFPDGAKRWRDKFSPAGNPDGTVVITLWCWHSVSSGAGHR